MVKVLEKIKNFFAGKHIFNRKCCAKKEKPKTQPEGHNPERKPGE